MKCYFITSIDGVLHFWGKTKNMYLTEDNELVELWSDGLPCVSMPVTLYNKYNALYREGKLELIK